MCFTVPVHSQLSYRRDATVACPFLYFKKVSFHARDAKFIRETHLLSYVRSLPIFFYPSPPSTTFSASFFFCSFLSTLSSSTFSCLLCYMDFIEAFSTKKRSHEGRTVRMRFSSLTVILMSITSRLSHRCYVCERESGPHVIESDFPSSDVVYLRTSCTHVKTYVFKHTCKYFLLKENLSTKRNKVGVFQNIF